MTTNTRGMSDPARELLVTALQPSGLSKGLLVMGDAIGGITHIRAGDQEWTFGRGEGSEYVQAFYELLDFRLIIETVIDGSPAGYIVTPLGCDAAQLLQWPPV